MYVCGAAHWRPSHCLAPVVQKLLKQGIHNLRSQQYQLLYVDDGVVHGDEQENWKVLKASETY